MAGDGQRTCEGTGQSTTRGREVALLEVHGAIEECNEGGHEEPSQVVGRAPPVHHRPLLHQLKHLHHTMHTLLCCLLYSVQTTVNI